MIQMQVQKRLAASVLGISSKKITFDITRLDDIKEAITKADVRKLVNEGAIFVKKHSQQSRLRARKIKTQKRKGRRQGPGSRKGKATARKPRKETWIKRIRLQRKFLNTLREKKLVDKVAYNNLYMKAKGGFFRSRRHITLYIEEQGLVKK